MSQPFEPGLSTPRCPFQTERAAFSKQECWFSCGLQLPALLCISSLVPNDSAVQCGVGDNRPPVPVASGWGLQRLNREYLQRDPVICPRATCSVRGPH